MAKESVTMTERLCHVEADVYLCPDVCLHTPDTSDALANAHYVDRIVMHETMHNLHDK